MTATRSAADAAGWAARVLAPGSAADPAAARRRFYERLAEHDFVLPPEEDAAQRVAKRPAESIGEPLHAWAWNAQSAHWRGAVESFATDFFRLPPGERRQRLEELSRNCAFEPSLIKRLDLLRPALDVNAQAPGANANAAALAGEFSELFLLPKTRRLAERQKHVDRWNRRRPEALAALDELRRANPEFVGLMGATVRRLEDPVRQSPPAPPPSAGRTTTSWDEPASNHG